MSQNTPTGTNVPVIVPTTESEVEPHPRHDSDPEYASFIVDSSNENDSLEDQHQIISFKDKPINSCEDARKRVISAEAEIQQIQQKKFREAIKKLDDILENNPEDFLTFYQKGCASLALGMYEEAKGCLEQANNLISGVELTQNQISLQYDISCVLAECYLKTGDRTRARGMFSNLTESFPTNFKAFFGLGMCESASGNFSGAIDQFQKAADLNPTDTDIPIKIARCFKCIGDRFLKEKKFSEAIDSYTDAIKRNKHNVVFYCKRGTAYFLSDRKEDAYVDFEQATQLYKTKMPDVVLAKDNTEIEAIFIEDIITQHIRSGFSG